MRWLLLAVIISCSKTGGNVKQQPETSDAELESANIDYIYNVYQLADSDKQDEWDEFSRLRFFTRLKLTDNSYPDTVSIAIGIDPALDGEGVDNLEKMEKIRWVVKPLPVSPLPGLYILPSSAIPFPMAVNYNVYFHWDHANRQVSKAILVVDINRETRTTTWEKLIFAEAERMPYDQAKAREMYLERKKLSPPAERWSMLDMKAFDQILRLYQLTGSPDEELAEFLEEENLVGETADEKLKRLAGYADKAVDNFLKTSGVHTTDQ